jgi:hypothetical protein
MKKIFAQPYKWLLLMGMYLLVHTSAISQTDIDAIMMAKKNFCIGPMYSSSSWDHYWEGTFKRDNANLGTVSTQMVSVMGNYGVSGRLNLLFGLPYISTKASAGTLHGQKGIQDLSLWVKWMPIETQVGKGVFSIYTIGGVSLPMSNYTPDFLPLSIGLHSKSLSLRAMADYQLGSLFATVSGTYVVRDKITIDRSSYYTTQQYLTNEVAMPDASSINARLGYRSNRLIAEAIFNKWATLGGFDMTKNNMPFPSNRMNASSLGINIKYTVKAVSGLSLIANGDKVISGRNIGQSTTIGGGIFYILDFSPKQKKSTSSTTK